ncbi:MAG TPA: hypothetical protein DD979_17590 [Gammaproteobacteria bacterium]|jgi:PhnB protein|nr:hypothetical protein [Gammaproteobacteria bacterium]
MHMQLRLDPATIMASDAVPDQYEKPQGFRIQIEASSREHFDRLFAALAADARVGDMAPAETFWAERFALFTDAFGTPWMLNYDRPKAEP